MNLLPANPHHPTIKTPSALNLMPMTYFVNTMAAFHHMTQRMRCRWMTFVMTQHSSARSASPSLPLSLLIGITTLRPFECDYMAAHFLVLQQFTSKIASRP